MALITLTTDIGPRDFLIGGIKGRLLQIDPAFNILDITHSLSPFNAPQAAYVCRNAFRQFPSMTFHIVLANLFDHRSDHLLFAYHKEQYILCADNGLLTMILEANPDFVIGLPINRKQPMNTLQYVSLMGNAIYELQSGKSLEKIGVPDISYVEKKDLRPSFSDDWIEGHIIFIDHFENIVLNITREEFEYHRRGRNFTIRFKRDEVIDRISNSYADVPEGEKLALFNSAGYLEIAINKGNAAGLLGMQRYSEQSQNQQNRVFYQSARIFFE
jgi:S-adenosylmethionine hydrolase